MTELMKRYEAETGKNASDELYSGSMKLYMPSNDYIQWLESKAKCNYETVEKFQEIIRNQCDEISALKEQLRWRLVSERPEKDGWYLCKVLYVNDTIGEETVHFDGERFVFSNVVKWLPIPPAPEGGVKCTN